MVNGCDALRGKRDSNISHTNKPSAESELALMDVPAQLQAYYADNVMPPWEEAVRLTTSRHSSERKMASQYLLHLVQQAYADQQADPTLWRTTPYWGVERENLAIRLQTSILRTLVASEPSVEILPLLQWYISENPRTSLQYEAMEHLLTFSGTQVNPFLLKLVTGSHMNHFVTAMAIEEIGKRQLTIEGNILASFCLHHHSAIRDATHITQRALNLPACPAFNPIDALDTPFVRDVMRQLYQCIMELPAEQAEFATVISTYTQVGTDREPYQSIDRGWIVEHNGNHITLHTPFGRVLSFELGEQRTENTLTTHRMDIVDIADEVARVTQLRAQGDRQFALSEQGGLTGQFQEPNASVYEAVLAVWLYNTQYHDLAANILFPLFDNLDTDDDLVRIVRYHYADLTGYRMLAAFVGERNYEEALVHARLLRERFPKTRFSYYADRLTAQLPKRMDDFTTFTLPTPEEWERLQHSLSRHEQIQYLCDHLRLLNAFQLSQPGGVHFGMPQYAEPGKISANASWGGHEGGTEVINPYVELTGNALSKDASPQHGMALHVADIAILAPYLKQDWYVLAVGFWRDFHPQRTLYSTRGIVASIINDIANEELVVVHELAQLKGNELDTKIEEIIQWSHAHRDKAQ